jgi:hypothetical protein
LAFGHKFCHPGYESSHATHSSYTKGPTVPLCFIQVGLAAALKNSIVYEIMQHWINFVSVVCVAFATGATGCLWLIIPDLLSCTVWYQSSSLRASVKESDGAAAPPGHRSVPAPLRFRHTHSSAESGLSSEAPQTPPKDRMPVATPRGEKTPRLMRIEFSRQMTA